MEFPPFEGGRKRNQPREAGDGRLALPTRVGFLEIWELDDVTAPALAVPPLRLPLLVVTALLAAVVLVPARHDGAVDYPSPEGALTVTVTQGIDPPDTVWKVSVRSVRSPRRLGKTVGCLRDGGTAQGFVGIRWTGSHSFLILSSADDVQVAVGDVRGATVVTQSQSVIRACP
jgi:hypothetical protein